MLDPDLIQRTLAAIENGLVLTPMVGGAFVCTTSPLDTHNQWIIIGSDGNSWWDVAEVGNYGRTGGISKSTYNGGWYTYVGFVGQDNVENTPVSQVDGWF